MLNENLFKRIHSHYKNWFDKENRTPKELHPEKPFEIKYTMDGVLRITFIEKGGKKMEIGFNKKDSHTFIEEIKFILKFH